MALIDFLEAYWGLSEASGNRADSHGANTLTPTNAPGNATGKIGNGASFVAASTQFLSIADNAALSFGDEDFTIAAWVYLNGTAATQIIAGKASDIANAAGTEYALYFSSTTVRALFRVSNGTTNTSVTANAFGNLSANTWYHVVGWHDSVNNVIGVAVNAGTPNTAAFSAGCQDGANAFRVGRDGSASRYMDGRIDELAVWRRVLTSQERTDLYNGGSGLDYSNFAGGIAYMQSIAGSLTSSGITVKRTARTLAGSLTPSAALVKTLGRQLIGSLNLAGAVARQTRKTVSGSMTSAGIIAKRTARLMSGSMIPIAGATKQVARSLTGSMQSSGGIAKRITKLLTSVLALVGNVAASLGQVGASLPVKHFVARARPRMFRAIERLITFRGVDR